MDFCCTTKKAWKLRSPETDPLVSSIFLKTGMALSNSLGQYWDIQDQSQGTANYLNELISKRS